MTAIPSVLGVFVAPLVTELTLYFPLAVDPLARREVFHFVQLTNLHLFSAIEGRPLAHHCVAAAIGRAAFGLYRSSSNTKSNGNVPNRQQSHKIL